MLNSIFCEVVTSEGNLQPRCQAERQVEGHGDGQAAWQSERQAEWQAEWNSELSYVGQFLIQSEWASNWGVDPGEEIAIPGDLRRDYIQKYLSLAKDQPLLALEVLRCESPLLLVRDLSLLALGRCRGLKESERDGVVGMLSYQDEQAPLGWEAAQVLCHWRNLSGPLSRFLNWNDIFSLLDWGLSKQKQRSWSALGILWAYFRQSRDQHLSFRDLEKIRQVFAVELEVGQIHPEFFRAYAEIDRLVKLTKSSRQRPLDISAP